MIMSTYRGKIRRTFILALACFTLAMLIGFIINVNEPAVRSRPPHNKEIGTRTLIARSTPDRESR
jgi:hypothetical protein